MKYPWNRYWIKQGENPVMDDGLFVEPSTAVRWFGPPSNGVPLHDLRDVPCLVLLGDVGMGKSTTLKKEAEELKIVLSGQNHAVVYEDLKRLSETQIERRIFHHPQVEAWLRGEHPLTLFLDSLDECWRRIEALELLLVEEFERRIRPHTPQLFLRLTCRSAEWRDGAGKTLERLFLGKQEPSPPVRVWVLAPLCASNVLEAAKSKSLNGDLLFDRIRAKEAQALASHPITLEMLLQTYETSGDFPNSRVDLYRAGCLRLCADEHIVSSSNQGGRKTSAPHRLAIASRLAAMCVYTNRLLINRDFEHPLSRLDVLDGADAAGYLDEQTGGEAVLVSRDTITETLQTGLFAEQIEGIQTWRHQSYAEFLAAAYVVDKGLTVPQIVALLTDTTDNAGRIIPQLEETSCWLVERKQSGENSALEDADVAFHHGEYERLRSQLQSAHEASSLPETPSEDTRAALNDLLIRIRLGPDKQQV